MTFLKTSLDTSSKSFIENTKSMKTLVEDLKSKVSKFEEGGGTR